MFFLQLWTPMEISFLYRGFLGYPWYSMTLWFLSIFSHVVVSTGAIHLACILLFIFLICAILCFNQVLYVQLYFCIEFWINMNEWMNECCQTYHVVAPYTINMGALFTIRVLLVPWIALDRKRQDEICMLEFYLTHFGWSIVTIPYTKVITVYVVTRIKCIIVDFVKTHNCLYCRCQNYFEAI